MSMRLLCPFLLAGAALLPACGGGSAAVELTVDGAPAIASARPELVLSGLTFIPSGSTCPKSSEYIVIGSFGAAAITTRNAATGAEGTGFLQSPWVCNSGSAEVAWSSHPITLAMGPNVITVTMRDAERTSTATVAVTRSGG